MKLLTLPEYESSAIDGRDGTLAASWANLQPFLMSEFEDFENRVFFNENNDDFPDDSYKSDICFGISDGERTAIFWNYKNGPVYDTDISNLTDIPEFSCGGDLSLLDDIHAKLKEFTESRCIK